MKKMLSTAIILGLCSATAVYLSSCAKQAGPLSPTLAIMNSGSVVGNTNCLTVTGTTAPGSVSGTARIAFNIPVNPATINTSTVQVFTMNNDGLGETAYNVTMNYNAAAKELVLNPSTGLWSNDTRYHILLTTGLQSMNGRALDGNGNNINESAEFDNKSALFNLGAPTSPAFTTYNSYVRMTGMSIAGGGASSSVASYYVGNVSTVYSQGVPSYVTLTVSLGSSDSSDPNWAMDLSTIFINSTTLHPNLVFLDANNNPVAPLSVSCTSATYNTIEVVFNNLQPASKYTMKIRGGLTGVRSSSSAVLHPYKGQYFDGNGSNGAEAVDDTVVLTMGTAREDGAAMPRLTCTAACVDHKITVTCSITAGWMSGLLDKSSVNSSTVNLIDEASGQAFAPASIEVDNSTPGTPLIYIYVPAKFYNTTSEDYRNVRLYLSQNIKTAEGMMMDNNSDTDDPSTGVAGAKDDYYTNTYSIYNDVN